MWAVLRRLAPPPWEEAQGENPGWAPARLGSPLHQFAFGSDKAPLTRLCSSSKASADVHNGPAAAAGCSPRGRRPWKTPATSAARQR